eukprot:CAMPEP_0115021626 /NCGR_PEP_ID=MMETSP0216-20121206/31013_1 /TAXON_ID=223996 /ORGANISM="Protocruzia adherens, Strain Boccale" /LENGTH=169 /DNA_ID=CAMNT_0002394047 /DNA_START=34 /DNA_END=543 /DNA_ORIENTATION=+
MADKAEDTKPAHSESKPHTHEQTPLECFLKYGSFIIGLGLITLGVVDFVNLKQGTTTANAGTTTYFLNSYYIIFGLLIILTEKEIGLLKRNFGFLYSRGGKGLFFIFIGTLQLRDDDWEWLIPGIILCVAGLLFLGAGCCLRKPAEPKDDKAEPLLAKDQEKGEAAAKK